MWKYKVAQTARVPALSSTYIPLGKAHWHFTLGSVKKKSSRVINTRWGSRCRTSVNWLVQGDSWESDSEPEQSNKEPATGRHESRNTGAEGTGPSPKNSSNSVWSFPSLHVLANTSSYLFDNRPSDRRARLSFWPMFWTSALACMLTLWGGVLRKRGLWLSRCGGGPETLHPDKFPAVPMLPAWGPHRVAGL